MENDKLCHKITVRAAETRKMMINIVATSDQPLTRTQIVNGLNRKKTPHLIDMMDGLVDEGDIQSGCCDFQQWSDRLCLFPCTTNMFTK